MKSVIRRVGLTVATLVRPARLLAAVKMTIASTAAWMAGSLLPDTVSEYAYYAPLGTLIAMTQTIATSLRSSVTTVVGGLLGLAVAWALILTGVNGVIAVALAVGIGTLLAGIPGLGVGRDYVPLAAVFVFVAAGSDVDGFSFGFIVQLAFGAMIGLAVNLVIPPPLATVTAKQALKQLRERVAVSVEDFAETLVHEEEGIKAVNAAWAEALEQLDVSVSDASERVRFAWLSRRGNARALARRARMDGATTVLERMNNIIRQLHLISEPFLADAKDAAELGLDRAGQTQRIPGDIRARIATVGRRTADHIRGSANADGEAGPEALLRELDEIETRIARWDIAPDERVSVRQQQQTYVVTYALRQMVSEASALRVEVGEPGR